MPAIKWANRYMALHAEVFDSLDEAVRSALYAFEAGDESLKAIEEVREDGTCVVHDRDAVGEMWAPIEQQRAREWDARPKVVVSLDVQGPGGDWAALSGYADAFHAEIDADEYRSLIGEDRVRLRPV